MASRALSASHGNMNTRATDERGSDGASHSYEFQYQPTPNGPEVDMGRLKLQNGDPAVAGVNGLSVSQVLVPLIDHLEDCHRKTGLREDQQAAWHLREAMGWLKAKANRSGGAPPAQGLVKGDKGDKGSSE